MNVTLWDTLSDVRKELSIQDDRTESDNRIEVMLLIGIAENNLPHIARSESTKPPYAEPHVRWCGRSVNVKKGGKCFLWLAFTSYPIIYKYFYSHYLVIPSMILTRNAFDHYDRSTIWRTQYVWKRYHDILIFTTKSCWFNNKVVFLRRKDLNREDYERFYFKKKVLG